MSEDDNSRDKRASSPATDGRPSIAPRIDGGILMDMIDDCDDQGPVTSSQRLMALMAAELLGNRDTIKDLLEALKVAADQFEFYGREHRKKQRGAEFNGIEAFIKEPREKAKTNERFAAMCRAAIAKASAPIGSETSENKPGV